MVEVTERLYLTNREDWRAWLERNHDVKTEIWLVYYKKHTGKPTIPYDDAVEEALCFGWIDSIVKRQDDEMYIQKYTPRKKKSVWSEANKKRANKMIKQGRMTEAGLAVVMAAKKSGEWTKANVRFDPRSVPPDLKKALAANKKAKENFDNLAPSYKKHYVWWITSAKREDTRRRRIAKTVLMIEENKKPGMM